jgi:hypothetical protein
MANSLGADKATERLGELASRLFGEEWAAALSRFTGVNLRTCQRAKAAADRSDEEPRAAGLLVEASRQLAALMPAILPTLEELAQETAPEYFVGALPKFSGLRLRAQPAALRGLRDVTLKASSLRGDIGDANLLLALSYDLRKAKDKVYIEHHDRPMKSEQVFAEVDMLWPLVLFQLKLLRSACGYLALLPAELAAIGAFEDAVLGGIVAVHPRADEAENVVEAWHEMGVDVFGDAFDRDALSRSAWFIMASEELRRKALPHLFESMGLLYDPGAKARQDGAPARRELDAWRDREWPEVAWY